MIYTYEKQTVLQQPDLEKNAEYKNSGLLKNTTVPVDPPIKQKTKE